MCGDPKTDAEPTETMVERHSNAKFGGSASRLRDMQVRRQSKEIRHLRRRARSWRRLCKEIRQSAGSDDTSRGGEFAARCRAWQKVIVLLAALAVPGVSRGLADELVFP